MRELIGEALRFNSREEPFPGRPRAAGVHLKGPLSPVMLRKTCPVAVYCRSRGALHWESTDKDGVGGILCLAWSDQRLPTARFYGKWVAKSFEDRGAVVVDQLREADQDSGVVSHGRYVTSSQFRRPALINILWLAGAK